MLESNQQKPLSVSMTVLSGTSSGWSTYLLFASIPITTACEPTTFEASVKSYKSINAWKTNLQATESSFTRLQDIMENAGELTNRVSFSKIVDNSIAKAVFG